MITRKLSSTFSRNSVIFTAGVLYSEVIGARHEEVKLLKALYDEEKNKERPDKNKISQLQNALRSSDAIEKLRCHQEPIENIYTSFNSNPDNGISKETSKSRIKSEGPNQLKEKKQIPCILRLLKEMVGVFAILLWVGAVLSFIAYGLDTSDPSNVSFLCSSTLEL